jgi:gliding motility-associated protein GldE
LLLLSAFFSGSETAYFALSPQDIDKLKKEDTKAGNRVLAHLSQSDQLLGLLLLGNNLVNVAIVLLAAFLMNTLFDFTHEPVAGFLLQTVCVTFLLAFFGEVLPKTLSTRYPLGVARRVSYPLRVIAKILYPFAWLLTRLTTRVNKGLNNVRSSVSIDELSQAVDLTESQSAEDKKILKGIVRFVNIDVRQVMRPRVNVDAVEIQMNFTAVRDKMIECGYSRIPVYEKTPDHVKGVLYVKDLMPYLYTGDKDFVWQRFIREAYFVPENKKINDLLEEFRQKKIHLAIVVDEYGGTEGIVTLEDILEEIVGEIWDETD